MTTVEVFQINQEINAKLAEMVETEDSSVRTEKQKKIMDLVTALCVALVDSGDPYQKGLAVM